MTDSKETGTDANPLENAKLSNDDNIAYVSKYYMI